MSFESGLAARQNNTTGYPAFQLVEQSFVAIVPIRAEVSKIFPTVSPPTSLWRHTAARAIEARQPQRVQSGWPPNWQGVILVFRSAESGSVVRAKMHCSGDCGGRANSLIVLSLMSSFENF